MLKNYFTVCLILAWNMSWNFVENFSMRRNTAGIIIVLVYLSFCIVSDFVVGCFTRDWHTPSKRKRKIYSSTWDLILWRYLLMRFSPFLSRFSRDWKREKRSTFKTNLNVALTKRAELPSESITPCLGYFLSILKIDENGGQICNEFEVEEEAVPSQTLPD